MVAYSTILLCFLLRERGGSSEREEEEEGTWHNTALVSLVKQILVILALVIYKIIKTSPCN
jgi:hypothetical protein